MAAIDPQTLLEEAKCYACFAQASLPEMLKLALLSRIASNGGGGGGGTWGSITGTLSNQLDLQAALNAATIAARPLTGAGSPVGVATPTYVGQFYTDLAGTQLFQASGLTNVDWIFWA